MSVATSADPEPFSGGEWLNAYRSTGNDVFTLDIGQEMATIDEGRQFAWNDSSSMFTSQMLGTGCARTTNVTLVNATGTSE